MFTTKKNSTRSENLDYQALMRRARAERARYFGLLCKNWLVGVRQLVQRQLTDQHLPRSGPDSLWPNH